MVNVHLNTMMATSFSINSGFQVRPFECLRPDKYYWVATLDTMWYLPLLKKLLECLSQ